MVNKKILVTDATKLDTACWKGYVAVGLKKKNGKTVPNCVPKDKEVKEDFPTTTSDVASTGDDKNVPLKKKKTVVVKRMSPKWMS